MEIGAPKLANGRIANIESRTPRFERTEIAQIRSFGLRNGRITIQDKALFRLEIGAPKLANGRIARAISWLSRLANARMAELRAA
jgi:hypothetical protein